MSEYIVLKGDEIQQGFDNLEKAKILYKELAKKSNNMWSSQPAIYKKVLDYSDEVNRLTSKK